MPRTVDKTAAPTSFTLGRYEVLGEVARGGMATVYLARLAAAGGFTREFALKVIHPHLADSSEVRARMLEEARLASRVRHPNAVRTVDAGEDQGYAFLVLELIDGVNLRELMLHRSRAFSPVQAAGIVVQAARGLHALHTATDEHGEPLGMVHRDVSPHNIMLDRTGRAILIDLGIAKATDRELTQVGVLCGKLPYMSPEQSQLGTLDGRSDVFSLGTVLFELVTGDLPFGETHSGPTLARLLACEAPGIEAALVAKGVPPWFREIVLSCLRPDPEDRIGSAAELADALAQELAAAGQDEALIRQDLQLLVEDAYETLGGIRECEALPARLPSGSGHRVLSPPTGSSPAAPPSGLRWALGGALGAVAIGGVAAYALGGAPTPAPEANADRVERGGGATVIETLPTQPPAARSQPPDSQAADLPIDEVRLPTRGSLGGATPPPPMLEDADPGGPKRRPGKKSQDSSSSPELKPNPYAAR